MKGLLKMRLQAIDLSENEFETRKVGGRAILHMVMY